MASIAVSPFDRPRANAHAGCVTGAAASVIRALAGIDLCVATGRRIPILHGLRLALRSLGRSRLAGACSRLPAAPYIFVQKGRAIAALCYHRP